MRVGVTLAGVDRPHRVLDPVRHYHTRQPTTCVLASGPLAVTHPPMHLHQNATCHCLLAQLTPYSNDYTKQAYMLTCAVGLLRLLWTTPTPRWRLITAAGEALLRLTRVHAGMQRAVCRGRSVGAEKAYTSRSAVPPAWA